MPGSALIHAVVFAAGALVGGGVAAAISGSRKQQQLSIPTPAQPRPVVDIGPSGATQISSVPSVVTLPSSVLKYGHPGKEFQY